MNGVLNVLKPPAMTSNDVISHIRRMTGIKKAGHTGTLDPGAAGVLPVCLGRATKLSDYIMHGKKEYIAELSFGVSTDTLDSYGTVVEYGVANIDISVLQGVMPNFVGELLQRPPMYSAVKHEGQALYKLARKGMVIEKEPRCVHIYNIELLSGVHNRFLMRIECSKGTYIRTLLADIATMLKTPAHTSFLMRTQTCGFMIKDAHTFDEIDSAVLAGELDGLVVPMACAVGFMPKILLEDYLYDIVITGSAIDLARAGLQAEEHTDYSVFCRNELIGIARRVDDMLKIVSMIKIVNRGTA